MTAGGGSAALDPTVKQGRLTFLLPAAREGGFSFFTNRGLQTRVFPKTNICMRSSWASSQRAMLQQQWRDLAHCEEVL
jgi:hypothetical protein